MKLCEMSKLDKFNIVCGVENNFSEIEEVYCGDLYSNVITKAKNGSIWITIMSTLNAIAVAVIKEISCIILTEGKRFDCESIRQANQFHIGIIYTDLSTYEVAGKLYQIHSHR